MHLLTGFLSWWRFRFPSTTLGFEAYSPLVNLSNYTRPIMIWLLVECFDIYCSGTLTFIRSLNVSHTFSFVWHLCSLSHTLPNHSLTFSRIPQPSLSTSICHGLPNASFVYLPVLPLRYVFLCCSTWIYFWLCSCYILRSRLLMLNLSFFNASVALFTVKYWILLVYALPLFCIAFMWVSLHCQL